MEFMEFNENDLTPEISIRELYESEEKEEKRKIVNDYQKAYNSRPDVKERIKIKKLNEKMTNEFKNLGISDPHEICKKLGHTIAWSRRNSSYFYRCSKCNVSYSDKEKNQFYKENKCPCCHLMLRTRKTITKKRSENI